MDAPPPPPPSTLPSSSPLSTLPSPSGSPFSLASAIMAITNPTPTAAVFALLVTLFIPAFLHFVLFRSRAATTLPTFLLLGPSSTGKTSLMTSFAAAPAETRTSQSPLSLECDIPATLTTSSKFRSTNDPSLKGVKRFLLQDTPGHGKLRPGALNLIPGAAVKGVVFVVDSAAGEWADAGEYLYSVLLRIQKLQEAKPAAKMGTFRVLVACNKSDLFTALPAGKIRAVLENEVGKVRDSKSRGIVEVGEEDKDDLDWLGEGGEGEFKFEQLEEAGITVDFKGGSTFSDGWRAPLGEWVGGSL